MRLPRECYQMQQVIETRSTSPGPASRVDRSGSVGLQGCRSGRQRLPERRGLGTLSLGQLEQPAPVSQGVVVRRQRPGTVPARPNWT